MDEKKNIEPISLSRGKARHIINNNIKKLVSEGNSRSTAISLALDKAKVDKKFSEDNVKQIREKLDGN